MSVPVTSVELTDGARLLTEVIYTYIIEFGHLALLAISFMQENFPSFFSSSNNLAMAFLLYFLLSV
jgi:hypothetical protein